MNENSLTGMVDILPLLAEQTSAVGGLVAAVVILILFAVASLVWRYYQSPLVRLSRKLNGGQLSPRDASHQLANVIAEDHPFLPQLNGMRFGKQSPQTKDVQALIQQVRGGD